MKNIYTIAPIWRYLVIISSIGSVLLFLFPVFIGNFSGKASDFIWSALAVGCISGVITYGIITSKVITSPEGIESISFGIKTIAAWDKVEKVDINSYGFVNLFFKEPLYKNQLINGLYRSLASDRIIQLSPYIEDVATSDLLRDIAKYIPNSNVPEFIAKNKRNAQSFQKIGMLGLYYLVFFLLLIPFTFALRKGAEHLESSGLQNITLISYIITTSLIANLFLSGIRLLNYNSEISKLKNQEISRKARAYYLSPFITLVMSFVISIIIWAILEFRSVVITREETFAIVPLLIGAASLLVSGVIEKLIFKKNVL